MIKTIHKMIRTPAEMTASSITRKEPFCVSAGEENFSYNLHVRIIMLTSSGTPSIPFRVISVISSVDTLVLALHNEDR